MNSNLQFREVIPDLTQPENWNEITLNTGGTPSTLQDVKVQQRAGGFCYKKQIHCNRFIYWRTNHDILELVEESLDVNLVGNHLRYRFTDTPILEGVSVHETINSVIVLVATVSSVHRLSFKHPDKLFIPGENRERKTHSIFKDATAMEASDPLSYHVINSTPCLPHTSASCLTMHGDAIFGLALATGSILLVTLDSLIGNATTVELRQDSIVPRFLSGLTEAFLGRNNEDNIPVSLVLHSINSEMYLFSVYQNGQLRAWSCNRANCLSITDLSDRQQPRVLGAQKHILRKTTNSEGELILAIYFCYSENSHVVVAQPKLDNGIIKFTKHFSIFTIENHDLVEMLLTDGGREVWCVWLTGTGDSAISHAHVNSSSWSWVTLEPPPPLTLPNNPMLDSRQIYLDAIFKPNRFTVSDIQKALSISRREIEQEESAEFDLRQQVCQIISQEILDEISQYNPEDEEYIEIANRCWSRLYLCCVQYHQTGTAALGLLALLPCCVVVIKKHTLSLLRPLDYLEAAILNNKSDKDDGESQLISILLSIELGEEATAKLDEALHLQLPLNGPISEIASGMETKELEALMKSQSKKEMLSAVRSLLTLLEDPESTTREDVLTHSLRGDLGLSTVVAALEQLVSKRMSICRALLILLWQPQWQACDPKLFTTAQQWCRYLWTQLWTCQALSMSKKPVLQQFLLSEGLSQYSILKSASTLAHYTWAGNPDKCCRLAQFLYETKEHLLIQELARLSVERPWQHFLVKSLLEIGEPYKAFDLVFVKGVDVHIYMEVIQLFEEYNCQDLVLALANHAVTETRPDDPNLPVLRSVLFLHHLKLGHYADAYASLEAQPEESRRQNCLRELVVALVDAGQIQLLLDLPFTGMLPQLEELLESRARTRDPSSATVYYDTLFALHIKNMNFRKGATVMMEQALRADNVQMMQQCYAVCLNTLTLVEPEYAWIVKPTGAQDDVIEVLELKHIRREYHLACARSKLKNCAPDTSPAEVVAQCVSAGHYKTALRLCHLCKLSYFKPLQALTAACVDIQDNDKAWQWLFLNEISDLVAGDANAKTIAWRLLQYLLNKYEVERQTTLHKVVASKLISLFVYLPHWLEASYKKRNCAELLRLYLRQGALKQASELGCEMLSAALGQGKEHYGYTHALLPTAPPGCLPLNTIDRLLAELSFYQMDKDLRKAVDTYLSTCKRVSDDKINSVSIMCL